MTIRTTRPQPARPVRFPRRRATAGAWSALGAQLCARDGSLINRDYERAWLPGNAAAVGERDVPMTITAPEKPGRYALKFDLVSEGIDWFEACGSPTTTKTLVVI